MGNCSSNYNPQNTACNNIGGSYASASCQSAAKAAAYARQALTSATNSENSFLEFNALYLGAFAVAPTVDNEGDPLQTGALYWNTALTQLFAWSGTSWVVAANFTEFTPFLATGSFVPRNLVTREADVANVKDFGVVGDGVTDDTGAFNNAAIYANSINAGVYIPKGNYFISVPTTNANWLLDNGAKIVGLANQPPFPQFSPLNDTSRLTGNAFNFNNSTLGETYKPIVRIGTTDPWLSKNWKYVGENVSNFVSSDDQGRPAGIFSTLVSNTSTASIGYSVGIHAINTSTSNGAWGIYAESIRAASSGNVLGVEIDQINLGNTVDVNPINSFGNGITANLWISTGGGTAAPFGGTGNDNSLAIGLIGNGNQWGRGIVIRDNSIDTIGNFGSLTNEAVAIPKNYSIAWHDNTGASSTLTGINHARTIIDAGLTGCAIDQSLRAIPGAPTVANTAIYRHQFLNNDLSTFYLRGEHLVIQMENFAGTESRVAQQWTAKNQGAGFSGFHINFASQLSFAPITDNTHILGHPSYRWNEIYCTNPVINVSDIRSKQQVRTVSEAEKNVAIKLKQAIKAFKFNEAVDKKGSDKARWHFGVIAQNVKDTFESEGLSAEDYGLFCYDEWDSKEEIKDKEGNIVTFGREAGNSYGVRYQELLAFIITTL